MMKNTLYQGELSIVDKVYNQIMTMVADGKWQNGEKLPSENEFCDMFSVSRVSVRAAMQRLKGQGFIVTRQSIGSFLAEPQKSPLLASGMMSDITGQDYMELFEFRQAIELNAIDIFVKRATDDDKSRLQRAVDGMIANSGELREFTRWDMDFHQAIVEGAHNKYFYQTFMTYRDPFFHYLEEINRLSSIDLALLASNHRTLCDSLLNNRPEVVKKRLLADNAHFYDTVFKHINRTYHPLHEGQDF